MVNTLYWIFSFLTRKTVIKNILMRERGVHRTLWSAAEKISCKTICWTAAILTKAQFKGSEFIK
jgi:hypothetical protein